MLSFILMNVIQRCYRIKPNQRIENQTFKSLILWIKLIIKYLHICIYAKFVIKIFHFSFYIKSIVYSKIYTKLLSPFYILMRIKHQRCIMNIKSVARSLKTQSNAHRASNSLLSPNLLEETTVLLYVLVLSSAQIQSSIHMKIW